jgi:hypothetical protein
VVSNFSNRQTIRFDGEIGYRATKGQNIGSCKVNEW